MNIKGMIQKAKEKLFGKEQEEVKKMTAQCTSDPNNYKNYKANFAEIISEGTIAATDTEKPDGSRTVYAEGGFIEPSEETVVHPEEGEVIVPEEQMKRVLGEVSMEFTLPDETKATVKQMLQEQEDEERMKQIMSEFEELTPEQQAAIKEKLQELNMTVEELAERFLISGREVERIVTQIIEGLKPCMKALTIAWANIVYIDEPWEVERLKMSNNERRRRGIPMIRRRQYIRIRQNRKKKKKG